MTRTAYVVVLKKDLPSPLAPESDDEKPAEAKNEHTDSGSGSGEKPSEKDKGAEKGKEKDKQKPPTVEIDFGCAAKFLLTF